MIHKHSLFKKGDIVKVVESGLVTILRCDPNRNGNDWSYFIQGMFGPVPESEISLAEVDDVHGNLSEVEKQLTYWMGRSKELHAYLGTLKDRVDTEHVLKS